MSTLARASGPPRWTTVLPVLLGVLAIVAATLALRSPTTPAPSRTEPLLAPVLSVRRAPSALATVTADFRLARGLAALMDRPTLGQARQQSCLVVDQDGRRIFERRPADPLVPASNLKVLTGLGALLELGADARLRTEVRAAAPITDGVLAGPLYLVGGGDPLLATADYAASLPNAPQPVTALETLADRIRDGGVREIRGPIVGDESRYDTERYNPAWRASYISDNESGPQSALTVNDGFATFRPTKAAAPAPAANAARVLAALLAARGIAVGGSEAGRTPTGTTVVASVDSLPVRDIVGQMLRESDNLTAELLVKELARSAGAPATTAAGIGVLHSALAEAGLPDDDLAVVDGSGLARSDKTTCRLLLGGLTFEATREAIEGGLAVAGESGTLAKRFDGHPAEGKVRAKTGSLDFVVGLTGWATPARGEPLAFALMANELPDRVASGRALQEELAALLVAYPDAPDPATLGPGAG